ncbi:hypothetical protein [Roseomonas chloroacetimidivorans]|uniref:pectate lyase family protein n=1 Tax=Roseomonas chloroacetimidivorans TaxID=1766656 RepID=UPI003C71D746
MNNDFLNSIQPVSGFAGMNGGTKGGNGGKTVTATSGDELQALIDGATGPIIIELKDNVRGSNTKDDEVLIKNKSFVSIVGSGSGVDFADIGIRFFGSKNLILHNVGVSKVKEGSKDAVGFESGCQNFIVSHCDLSSQFEDVSKDYYDGILDVKRGSIYGTFLYNHLHDHHKAPLVGHTDDDTTKPLDRFISYYRNWFRKLGSRCPSVRYGFADIQNNYYLDIDTTAINLREGAKGYVSGNVFENVDDPIVGVDSDFPGCGTWARTSSSPP